MHLMILLFKNALILFLLNGAISTPILEFDKGLRYEEYEVEHEISSLQAKNSVMLHKHDSVIPPAGCQACSVQEKRYCLGPHLINDHCCCDKRYHEPLPFIPHTCYQGTQLCKTVAQNCEEYRVVRACCCDKYVLEKWRNKNGGPSHWIRDKEKIFVLCILHVIYILVYNHT